MTLDCPVCLDRGIVRVNWADAPDDYAICICGTGLELRVDRNSKAGVYPLWHLWCAREGVSQDRVFLLEDVLTPEEIAARSIPADDPEPPPPVLSRDDALLQAGRTRFAGRRGYRPPR